jgi:hypothetical protein
MFLLTKSTTKVSEYSVEQVLLPSAPLSIIFFKETFPHDKEHTDAHH